MDFIRNYRPNKCKCGSEPRLLGSCFFTEEDGKTIKYKYMCSNDECERRYKRPIDLKDAHNTEQEAFDKWQSE